MSTFQGTVAAHQISDTIRHYQSRGWILVKRNNSRLVFGRHKTSFVEDLGRTVGYAVTAPLVLIGTGVCALTLSVFGLSAAHAATTRQVEVRRVQERYLTRYVHRDVPRNPIDRPTMDIAHNALGVAGSTLSYNQTYYNDWRPNQPSYREFETLKITHE